MVTTRLQNFSLFVPNVYCNRSYLCQPALYRDVSRLMTPYDYILSNYYPVTHIKKYRTMGLFQTS